MNIPWVSHDYPSMFFFSRAQKKITGVWSLKGDVPVMVDWIHLNPYDLEISVVISDQWPFQEPIYCRYLPYRRPILEAYVREYPNIPTKYGFLILG